MTEIKAFKGIHYNSEKFANATKVVCPPYDVISPAQQDAFHTRSEHNFIRLEAGKDKPGDDKDHNKYTRARDIFNSIRSILR
jgi:uncharacterized protein (DUF1015 family)